MEANPKKIEPGDRVETPEGAGEVKEESILGQFRIKIPGVGARWYFEEDLEILEKGEGA
jgi:hypothetical protein